MSPARADAIRQAAAELGYRPNAAARTLRTGTARAIGLAVPLVTQPFFGLVLSGAQAEARTVGLAVMLLDAESSTDAFELLQSAGAVDGLLWHAGVPPKSVLTSGPVVVMESQGRGFASVRFAVEGGFESVGRHLRELGHRRVGHITAAGVAS